MTGWPRVRAPTSFAPLLNSAGSPYPTYRISRASTERISWSVAGRTRRCLDDALGHWTPIH
ncbi:MULTISPECIES: hypothetical protein [unclassified Streptomyces]|uniref:hypothetical protein n=1 Tax=unclassified Streptomyces TaxID=2593676 RepID=UPI00331AA021